MVYLWLQWIDVVENENVLILDGVMLNFLIAHNLVAAVFDELAPL